jgi:5-formyltetrahydrofolate cyclo-ligase
MTKSLLRAQNLSFRKTFTDQNTYTKSKLIFDKMVQSINFENIKSVHIYKSKSDEIDTSSIIDFLLDNEIAVFVPITNPDNTLRTVEISRSTVFGKDKFGVSSPIDNYKECEISKFDLIIIPLVGFDAEGNRVGYGKGCYDEFLSRSEGYRLGLGFEWQKSMEIIEVEYHDQKLDGVCTESESLRF